MKVAQRRRINTARRATPHAFPAPVGGWNNRDAITAMKPEDAIELVNWFPDQSYVRMRAGYTRIVDLGTDAPVGQLVPYHVGTDKCLLAFSAGRAILVNVDDGSYLSPLSDDDDASELYDDDNATPLFDDAQILSLTATPSSDYVSYAQMGNRLIMCNGGDEPFSFDGTELVPHGFVDINGVLIYSRLNFVHVHGSRVYFIEGGTQAFWYGDPNAVQGTLHKFDLGVTGSFRGELKILTSITGDGGEGGPDDLFVAIFSEGDVAVYQGTDPGDASNWRRIGVYKIGEPLSRFGHATNGGDITILTSRGYESLVRSTREGEGVRLKSLVSDKIQIEVSNLINVSGSSDLWRLTLYNRGQMLIVQAPLPTAMRHHVRNINTGAWCRFSLDNIHSWAILDQICYVGDKNGRVHIFDRGNADDDRAISYTAVCAWNSLRSPGFKKLIQGVFLNISASFFPNINVSIAKDFDKHTRFTTAGISGQESPVEWNQAYWDDNNYFGAGFSTREIYHKHGVEGKNLSLRLDMHGRNGHLFWNSTTYHETSGSMI